MAKERCSISEMLKGLSADDTIEVMKALDLCYFKDSIKHQFKNDSVSSFWIGYYCGELHRLWFEGKISKRAYTIMEDYFYYECV